jgi:hypothetical protein
MWGNELLVHVTAFLDNWAPTRLLENSVLNGRPAAEVSTISIFYSFLAFVKRSHMNYSGIYLDV